MLWICRNASKKRISEDFQSLNLDEDFDLVISSPSQRCCLLAEYFKFDYKTDERLREMNFGNWELKKWTEIPKKKLIPGTKILSM
jgi:alpha-ribazole phosphatase